MRRILRRGSDSEFFVTFGMTKNQINFSANILMHDVLNRFPDDMVVFGFEPNPIGSL
jgi:hypothetical protein